MSYDWKQLGAKIAKVGLTFLATGGMAVVGGADPVAALLTGITGEAISNGFGELIEGVVSGIQPKDNGVYNSLRLAIKNCIANQLEKLDCPQNKLNDIQSEIMATLFESHSIAFFSAEPQRMVKCIKGSFEKYLLDQDLSDEDINVFVDNLFSEIVELIDKNHEFTTTIYLKSIITEINSIQKSMDENQHIISNSDAKLSELLELVNSILARFENEDTQLAPNQKSAKYAFVFGIGTEGQALELSRNTRNAIMEWFYDCARSDLSTIPDGQLVDTFTVTIDDQRVHRAQSELDRIKERMQIGEILDVPSEHKYSEFKKTVNWMNKENQIKTAAIELYLSDRVGQATFNTFDHLKLIDIIAKILEHPYFDTFELDNNQEYIMLDIYLNFSGYNESYERFIIHMKECDVKACFGGTSIYDIWGCNVCDLGTYRHIIAPYFYQHLGALKIVENFDFSQNKRLLDPYNYYVGLH